MRKKLLMACLLVGGSVLYANAQTQLNNSGMENWENVDGSDQEPVQWNSFLTASGNWNSFADNQIKSSTQIRPGSSGSKSAVIWTRNAGLALANGNLTTGQINMGSTSASNSSNHNISRTGNSAFSEALNAWPDSLVFWCKFKPINAASMARVRGVIHDTYDYRDPSASDAHAPAHVVADATLNYGTTNNQWVRKSIPFNYTGPATSANFILLTFTTNQAPGGGNTNDSLYIDDIELVYNPVTTTPTINPLTYNVSTTAGANITIPYTKTGIIQPGNTFTAQLSDATGSFSTPTNLGTLVSTSAGSIAGIIPGGTPNGTGYRVRVIASSPYQTANTNASDITINLVSNSIAPTTAQTIAAGIDGATLTVSETTSATNREWKFSSTPGGPYTGFSPTQTGTNYIPNFSNAGAYYVVCETSVGSLTARSNEVTVNVVKNQITPAGSQSLLVGAAGTTLTVTETPAAASREWLYSSTSGSGYVSFSTAETGTTYQPLFNTPGTYYVISKSVISGLDVISNEVAISVGSFSISTGTVAGSPFEFSISAPNATVSIPYTVSDDFNAGNIFTAQLSDANGSFATPTNIGTLASITDGIVVATIPSSTPDGNGYLVRVIGSDPGVSGSDNGTALDIDQFSNNITPGAAQSFIYTAIGNALTVTESQNATSREWRSSIVQGGPYTAIASQTGPSYTPSFPALGTFYVVAASTNQYSDEVLSNEVAITTTNGSTLNTSTIVGAPFYVSPSANNVVSVNFTSDVIFDAGNVFTAELSNGNGSFAAPLSIGTLSATNPGAISATMPNIILDGSGYRVRVNSTMPPIIGNDNGTDLEVINYNISVSPADTQNVTLGMPCTPINLTSTHPGTSVEWKYRLASLGDYYSFAPPITGNIFTRTFPNENSFKIVAEAVNNWGDTITSEQIVINVAVPFGINESNINGVKAYMNGEQFVLDITGSNAFVNPNIELVNMAGQVVYQNKLQGKSVHSMPLSLASGIYTYRISENGNLVTGKIPVL